MSGNLHLNRVNSDIMKVVSNCLLFDVNNPKIYGVSVVDAQTTDGYGITKIFVSILDKSRQEVIFNELKKIVPFVRKKVAANVKLKKTPQIKFVLDVGTNNVSRVEQLLQQINKDKREEN